MRRGFESEPALCPPRQRPLTPAAYHQSPPPPPPWPLLLTGVFAPLPLKMAILGGATGPGPCREGNEACLWGTGTSGL